MKISKWGTFGIAIIFIFIAVEIIDFAKDNPAEFIVISTIILSFSYYILKTTEREKEKKANLEASKRILKITKGEFIRGHNIKKEIGWVSVKRCSSLEELEHRIKVAAGKKWANAITKFHWTTRKDSYVAGHGKKGNPYYRQRTLYDGEGFAVITTKASKK